MILCSFKTPSELYTAPPNFLPVQFTLHNYVDLFTQTGFARYFVNSLIVATGSTVLSLLLGAIGGYTLSRFNFFGLAIFAAISLLCYMLPETLVVIPLYVLVSAVGLQDTLVSLIGANTAFTLPFALWFMRTYFRSVPASFEESAMLDGCTRWKAFWKVTLPIAMPGVISVGVFAFNNAWNEFLFALVLTSSERNKTLPLGLSTWIGQDSIYSWGMLLAGATLLTIFSVVLYLATQSRLVPGLADGGAKG
jgi:ABC-type glycerol-3-phosphate transport system permease component